MAINEVVVSPDKRTVITLDLDLYERAVKVRSCTGNKNQLILHIAFAALEPLGTYLEGSGLDQIWIEKGYKELHQNVTRFHHHNGMSLPSLPSVSLVHEPEPSRPDLTKCIICKKQTGSNKHDILTNAVGSRSKLILASKKLNDGLLDSLDEVEVQTIRFHAKSCYSTYILKASRLKEPALPDPSEEAEATVVSPKPMRSSDRLSSPPPLSVPEASNSLSKLCIICNNVTRNKVREKYRICERSRAKCFLAAVKFNHDDVFTRCVFLHKIDDVFSADLYAHKLCTRNYLSKFKRDAQSVLDSMDSVDENETVIHSAFESLCTTFDLGSKGYDLTTCRNYVNNILPSDKEITNRTLRNLLSKKYGDNIAFTYSQDSSKPQMFYSVWIDTSRVAETVRRSDPVKDCSQLLQKELKQYDFGISSAYCDADDLKLSFKSYEQNRPIIWSKFFCELLGSRELSKKQQRVCDSVFQILHALFNNSITPLSISFAESIHDKSRCKHLMTLANRLGFSVSYDSIQRIDTSLALRIIEQAGSNRVPVSPTITSSSIIHGSMDNFDKNDGKEGSHDTILMLFQNPSEIQQIVPAMSEKKSSNQRKFTSILPCQILLPFTKVSRGNIPGNYQVSDEICNPEENSFSQYKMWLLARFVTSSLLPVSSRIENHIPSFSAVNSILSETVITVTTQAYTPILPHPATEFDSIFTSMRNFQDVLKQRGSEYGALWSDEGVYRIAKEIQFLNPVEFKNIFLGLGGFHMEKIVLACCGQFLKFIGARDIFVINEIFGPVVTDNKVMTGGHYKNSRQGMRLLSEAIERIRFEKFVSQLPSENQHKLKTNIEDLHWETEESPDTIRMNWNDTKKNLDEYFFCLFKHYIQDGERNNDKFKYWNIFLDIIMPVLIDLTRSFREGNWTLHLSAVRRAMPLFFAFGHINYCRWVPIYYEDCLNLQNNFPRLHASFLQGDFVVHHTVRRGSAVPMDQALEMAYNKPAKGPGGVIGFTRQKESVAKWNIIKHEKSKILSLLDDICDMEANDEYSIHYEFSDAVTERDENNVDILKSFLSKKADLFEPGDLSNVVSGKVLKKEETQFLLSCYENGDKLYKKYRQDRMVDKSTKLFDRIQKPKILNVKVKEDEPKVDLQAETLALVRVVDVARGQGYDIKELLSYEITSSSFFLTKEGFMRKADKSDLIKEFKDTQYSLSKFQELYETCERSGTFIDFMAYARRLHTWINKYNLKTFGDMIQKLWDTIWTLGLQSNRVDIVFDLYSPGTTKASERKRRSSGDETRRKIENINQPLPTLSEIKSYWSSDENKKEFQQLFISWVFNTYYDEKPVYLGGCHQYGEQEKCYMIKDGIKRLVPELTSPHDEADDRMMTHINHAVRVDCCSAALICSRDTDVYVSFVYHFSAWKSHGLVQAWMEDMGTYVPIHSICAELGDDMVEMLPAVHTLTGCDTTSKVGTKKKALSVMKKCEHQELKTFGLGQLDESMYNAAEQFLLKCMPKSSKVDSFDSLRHSTYHDPNFKLNIERFPCCSSSLRHHIKRAFCECFKIKNCLVSELCNPEEYSYEFDANGELVPVITGQILPSDFPLPCTCGKCARANVCPCRVKGAKCTDFCKCKGDCRNPLK